MAAMDDLKGKLVEMEFAIGALRKLLLDNSVVAGKTQMTALKTLVDNANTLVQACTQVVGDDFFELD